MPYQKITLRTKLSNFITVGFSPHSCVFMPDFARFCLQAQVTCLHLHSLLQQLVQARFVPLSILLLESWHTVVYLFHRKYYEHAIDIFEKLRCHKHPSVAMALHNLGAMWEEAGEITKAISHYQEAFAIKEEIYGSYHLEVSQNPNVTKYLAMKLAFKFSAYIFEYWPLFHNFQLAFTRVINAHRPSHFLLVFMYYYEHKRKVETILGWHWSFQTWLNCFFLYHSCN